MHARARARFKQIVTNARELASISRDRAGSVVGIVRSRAAQQCRYKRIQICGVKSVIVDNMCETVRVRQSAKRFKYSRHHVSPVLLTALAHVTANVYCEMHVLVSSMCVCARARLESA